MNSTVFTVDPGVSGTGIAIWNFEYFKIGIQIKNVTPLKQIAERQKEFLPEKILDQKGKSKDEHWFKLKKAIQIYNCRYLICEGADYRKSDKGKMVAESGDLVALAKYIGGIQHLCFELGINYEEVSANKWKGSWNKEKVVTHIKKIWPDSIKHCANEKTAHTWEAAGIGFWKIGRL